MLKAVTLNEIEKIFEVLDALGLSREAVIIPLRPEHPGRVSLLKDGKLEIVVERDGDFAAWVKTLENQIRALMDAQPED
jgi:hypothetical protein